MPFFSGMVCSRYFLFGPNKRLTIAGGKALNLFTQLTTGHAIYPTFYY
jgi:hypothetical protein